MGKHEPGPEGRCKTNVKFGPEDFGSVLRIEVSRGDRDMFPEKVVGWV